ncbi:MAG: hypothetical protein KDB34_05585 [Propionibacteriaceae bacterium]|nr:hypothetical protein [Propionibacteriaceae bacterium]MEA5121364.1 hypothetical protein [Propionibacterium sp.]
MTKQSPILLIASVSRPFGLPPGATLSADLCDPSIGQQAARASSFKPPEHRCASYPSAEAQRPDTDARR